MEKNPALDVEAPRVMDRVGERFPLGRPFDTVDDLEVPSGQDARPFGLRFVRDAPENAWVELDPERLAYDRTRQIAVISENDGLALALKHTSTKTKTQTASRDRTGPDSDEDASGT